MGLEDWKAVSWALRNLGKRNRVLNAAAIASAERIRAAADTRASGQRGGDPPARTARWVAAGVIRELASPAVQARLALREEVGGRGATATRRHRPAGRTTRR